VSGELAAKMKLKCLSNSNYPGDYFDNSPKNGPRYGSFYAVKLAA
jgi:hypothetical protein